MVRSDGRSAFPPNSIPQEKSARPRFLKESEAKGYCNRLKTDLIRYSDKARGLTDAQKIEAQACFERSGSIRCLSHPSGRSACCPSGPCRKFFPSR